MPACHVSLSQSVILVNIPSKIFAVMLSAKCHLVSDYLTCFHAMVITTSNRCTRLPRTVLHLSGPENVAITISYIISCLPQTFASSLALQGRKSKPLSSECS